MRTDYRYFDHEAGTGIEGLGPTPELAFVEVAQAMFALMAEPATVIPERRVVVEFDAADLDLAMLAWLNRLLGQARLHGLVLNAFELKRAGAHWQGEAWGMPWRPGGERGTEVREATVTGLRVVRTEAGWLARCVVDG